MILTKEKIAELKAFAKFRVEHVRPVEADLVAMLALVVKIEKYEETLNEIAYNARTVDYALEQARMALQEEI